MSVKKLMPRIIEDIDPPFGPVAVMKYDNDGLYVPASGYAALLARHNALVEAVAWERECWSCPLKNSSNAEKKGFSELWTSRRAARAEVDKLLEEG